MSLEQAIADLQTQAGLLLDLPQDIADQANAKITALASQYSAIVAGSYVTAYVDQAVGLDTNAGTIGSPYKSIEKALSLTPVGGVCEVYLQANYTFSADLLVLGKTLVLRSSSSVKHQLNFDRNIDTSSTPNYRGVFGFYCTKGAKVTVNGLTVNYPVLDGGYTSIAAARDGLFTTPSLTGWELVDVTISQCDIVIPASPYCAMFAGLINLSLVWYANTLTGSITSPNGYISADQTNPAGVATTTLPWIVTNLSTI